MEILAKSDYQKAQRKYCGDNIKSHLPPLVGETIAHALTFLVVIGMVIKKLLYFLENVLS